MSTIAVFLALGGTSIAALRIGSRQIVDNSIRSVDIRNNGVRGTDVRNGTLTGADIRRHSLTSDLFAPGAIGAGQVAADSLGSGQIANLHASDFAPGELPSPVPATLPSGKTLKGMFASAVTGGTGIARSPISFPLPLASDPVVWYVLEGTASPASCPGTPADPAAAPGNFCVFEAGTTGNITFRGVFDPVTGANFQSGTARGASRFGAAAFVNGDAGAAVRGTWAVTAP
jgi:hypothetical protein